MIFVVIGSTPLAFDRLIKAVDLIAKERIISESFLLQIGQSTYRPKYCSWVNYLSFRETFQKIKQARLIISHAGAGTFLLCSDLGKRPILVPRQKIYGEAVDDHQVLFAKRMAQLHMSYCVENLDDLRNMIISCINSGGLSNEIDSRKNELINYLNEFMKYI